MLAARLHGPKDLRIDEIAAPGAPGVGQVKIAVGSIGLCGSDMHMYETGAMAGETIATPMILGHEFMGTITELGDDARDGHNQLLKIGQRVAVDPACPCWRCECCEEGNPNLCPNHTFYGAYPTDGSLTEVMNVEARNCFPIPDDMSDDAGALLETLGVAIHAVDLGKLKVGRSVAVIGCGPVGMLILRLAKMAGAGPLYAFDRYEWRTEFARRWGADEAWTVESDEGVAKLEEATNGRGADVVFEVASADESLQQAADMTRFGGRLVLVGIPSDDQFRMTHGTPRRKGLTIMMVRRMKHVYPRAIRLASGENPSVPLDEMVSEAFNLKDAPQAYAKNFSYAEGVQKLVIRV